MKVLSRPLFLALALTSAACLTPGVAKDTGTDRHDGPPEEHDHEESAGTTTRAKFSDPSKPGTLKISLPWAEARVTAIDGNEIIVTSTLEQKGHREVDHEGFRRLDEDLTFELEEKNNVATITIAGDNPWIPQGAEFDIKVPRNTNLILRTEAGGDISVTGVEGDIDINSMNGEVTLEDIASSAVVNTMNGEIHASFRTAPVKPVSLSSMNGEIDLRLPTATKANVRMRTHNGSIRTNFPEGALQTKTEKNVHVVSADSREYRDYQRDLAHADRDRAKAAADVAKARAAAGATPEATTEVETKVQVEVDGEAMTMTAPVAPRAPMAPIPPMPPLPNFGGKSIIGTLNGGGVDIKLTSMNGTITLRESK
jgi:Putative adhesin